jgi:hypothetical protein
VTGLDEATVGAVSGSSRHRTRYPVVGEPPWEVGGAVKATVTAPAWWSSVADRSVGAPGAVAAAKRKGKPGRTRVQDAAL